MKKHSDDKPQRLQLPAEARAQLQTFLAKFPRHTRYLVGVSGGGDSVALLHILATLGFSNLVVCHLNHGLRGRESQHDARFVKQLAATLGFPYESEKVAVKSLAKRGKQSLETAARQARYAFFSRCGTRHRCRRIFLGHHADDRAETFLFNLFRGAGAVGLSALASDSKRRIDGHNLRILRPLLPFQHADLVTWLTKQGHAFCEDTSNDDLQFTRNRMRHQIIPLLERCFGRNIRNTVARTVEILEQEDALLTALTAQVPLDSTLRCRDIAALPIALQRRALFTWLQQRRITNIGFKDIEQVRSLLAIAPHTPAKVNLPGDRFARRRNGILFIE